MLPLSLALLSLSLALSTTAQQLALNEPPDGQLYLGAWLDSSQDSPAAFNQRLGRNASWFQFQQNIPLDAYDEATGAGGIINASTVFETDTNAGIYVTVYPYQGLAAIQPQDFATLGVQLQQYALSSRAVFLRFAPEFNGNWDIWGVQPTLFKSTWITMYTSIKTSCPTCAIVWSPNAALGYPYSLTPDMVPNATDRAALDTNNDGKYDNTDDAYSPYWPGDEYVDWAGVSYYYKGVYPNSYNVAQQPGTVEAAMTGYAEAGLEGDAPMQYTEFYNTYCSGPNRPCMLSESGAAWHVNQTLIPANYVPPDHSTVEQAWWRDGITNSSFLSTYPKLKMLMMFEWEKVEVDDNISTLRDFRLTNDSEVLAGFQSDLDGVADRYLWAGFTPAPAPGSPGAQIPLPQPEPARATPYRQSTPTSLSLFANSALSLSYLPLGGLLSAALILGATLTLL